MQYACDVRDGKIYDPHFLPVIFEHPTEMVEKGEHLLLENIAMVNPNLGYSVDKVFLNREYQKPKESGEASFRGFLAKHANVEIGLALRSDRWAGADFWSQQSDSELTLETLLNCSEVVTMGIDGGGLDDLLGLSIVGRCKDTRKWLSWSYAWGHNSVLERRKSEATKLLDFEKEGDFTLVKQVGDDNARTSKYC